MNKVKKAVIPAAGLGTRFLPATKTVPKEMLPIVDVPIIYHVVQEALRAGVEDIVIIAGRGKGAIEDFFDVSYELQDQLESQGKTELLSIVKEIQGAANIISVRQKKALGLGHAVHCAKPVVGNEPFAVLLGDEIMFSEDPEKLTSHVLVNSYHQTGLSSVAVMEVGADDVEKYGIISSDSFAQEPFRVANVVEKPSKETAPSRFALPGRYVFDAAIFNYLENAKPGKNGEIQLTDAMSLLAENEGLLALTNQCHRYDAGDKLGFLVANIEFALRRPELQDSLKNYLKQRF